MIVQLLLVAVITALTHASPCKRVVCYYTNWAQYRPEPQKFFPEDVDATKCTHINYAFAKIEGNKLAPYEWNDDSTPWSKGMYERLHDHAKHQNPNVKILLSVGGWNQGSTAFTQMVATPIKRKEFATDSVEFLRKRNFDGLDLDWEYPGARGSPPEDKENYVELLKTLLEVYEKDEQDRGRPRLLLTAAVAAGKQYINPGYDVPRISKYLDFINVMTYDLHGSWEKTTGHNSPLYPRSGETGDERDLNVDWVMRYWTTLGAPKDKLVLGLPTYGRTFTLTSPGNSGVGAPARRPGTAGKYTREAGFLSYYEICDLISAGADVRYIEEQKVPYLVKGDQWVGYDDVASLQNKVKYMRDEGYGGVMVWTFDLDDFSNSCGAGKYPLLSAIVGECAGSGGSTPAPTQTPSSTEAPNTTEGTTPRPTSATTVTTTTTSTTTTTPISTEEIRTSPGTTTASTSSTVDTTVTTTAATTSTTSTSTPAVSSTTVPTTTTSGDLSTFCEGKPDGLYADPTSCHNFIQCFRGVTYIQPCAPGTVFNPELGVCDMPENVPGCQDK